MLFVADLTGSTRLIGSFGLDPAFDGQLLLAGPQARSPRGINQH